MAHPVICLYCKKKFDRDKIACKQIGRRYAHIECAAEHEANKTQEEKDKEALFEYINKMFGTTFVSPKIQKQIKTYVESYQYTYSGILKALIYFFEVKKNPIDKNSDTIGIVPFIYNDAFNYYYNLWLIQETNSKKDIQHYEPQVIEVHIPIPQRKVRKKQLFTFLDDEI